MPVVSFVRSFLGDGRERNSPLLGIRKVAQEKVLFTDQLIIFMAFIALGSLPNHLKLGEWGWGQRCCDVFSLSYMVSYVLPFTKGRRHVSASTTPTHTIP